MTTYTDEDLSALLGATTWNEFFYTHLEQFEEGRQLEYVRYAQEIKWERLYMGDFLGLSLGIKKTVENGLEVIDFPSSARINWFRIASTFYQDALTSERPTITMEDGTEPDPLVVEQMWTQIVRAVEYWSIKGRIVLIKRKDGTLLAVNPTSYYPIRAEWDDQITLGHALVYRYWQPVEDVIYRTGTPDRVKIVLFDKELGVNVVRYHELHGQLIGSLIEEVESDIEDIFVWGEGERDTFYPQMEDLVRELVIREAYASQLLNKHSAPILIVPTNSGLIDDDGNVKLSAKGSVIEIDPAEMSSPPEYVVWDGHLEANDEKIKRIVNDIHLATGVPPVVFGIDQGKGESGESRDRLMFSAMARVRRVRKGLELAMELVLGGNVEVSWVSSPFATEEERRAAVLREFAIGVITANEARELLDYDMMEDDEMFNMTIYQMQLAGGGEQESKDGEKKSVGGRIKKPNFRLLSRGSRIFGGS